MWFSALREREKGSSLRRSVSTQLFWLVLVALVLLLLLWCGGPFPEIPVRGAAERAHTRCGGFSISRRIALHTRGERDRKNQNCVVAQTNRRGEGRRTFENQISGVQHFASATDELPDAFSNHCIACILRSSSVLYNFREPFAGSLNDPPSFFTPQRTGGGCSEQTHTGA